MNIKQAFFSLKKMDYNEVIKAKEIECENVDDCVNFNVNPKTPRRRLSIVNHEFGQILEDI